MRAISIAACGNILFMKGGELVQNIMGIDKRPKPTPTSPDIPPNSSGDHT